MKIDGEAIMEDFKYIIVRMVPCTEYVPRDPSCTQERIDEFFASQDYNEILVIFSGK